MSRLTEGTSIQIFQLTGLPSVPNSNVMLDPQHDICQKEDIFKEATIDSMKDKCI